MAVAGGFYGSPIPANGEQDRGRPAEKEAAHCSAPTDEKRILGRSYSTPRSHCRSRPLGAPLPVVTPS